MFVKLCFFFVLFLNVLDLNQCYDLEEKISKLIDPEWQCRAICMGNGGKAKFIAEYKICKCWIDKYIDDADLQLMLKNARAMDLKLITVEPIQNRERKHVKRDTSLDNTMEKLKTNLKSLKIPKLTLPRMSLNETLGQKIAILNKKMEPLKLGVTKSLGTTNKALENSLQKLKSRFAEIKEKQIPLLKSRLNKISSGKNNLIKKVNSERNTKEVPAEVKSD